MSDIHKHSSAFWPQQKLENNNKVSLQYLQYLHKRQTLTSFPLYTKLLFQSPPEREKIKVEFQN